MTGDGVKKVLLLSQFPVDISGTVMGESPDCLLLSGTVVSENPDHVCWVALHMGMYRPPHSHSVDCCFSPHWSNLDYGTLLP